MKKIHSSWYLIYFGVATVELDPPDKLIISGPNTEKPHLQIPLAQSISGQGERTNIILQSLELSRWLVLTTTINWRNHHNQRDNCSL